MTAAVLASEERAMVRAVLLDPWDDGPRLILADWYEEHGCPGRAAWIRAMLLPGGPTLNLGTGTVSFPQDKHKDPDPFCPGYFTYDGWFFIRRGLVEGVTCKSTDFCSKEGVAILFGEQPVTEVRFTDKDPLRVTRRRISSEHYCWSVDQSVRSSCRLPYFIFDLLPGRPRNATACYYPTNEDALADLSQACVAYGRSLAGLPPLPARPA